ncbi:pyridoxal-phosphate dependent enzyme [Bradymonas sediminis]|nr:pyridoxal-phosphate dependent enzyme [Bradymonas sediminis]TDP71971.1 cysteine synthase A [Bradymonas sediminis]
MIKGAIRAARGKADTPIETQNARGLPDLLTVNRIDALIGNTPLVKLNRITQGEGADVYIKMENVNPSGSIRDRYTREIVTHAVRAGYIVAGDSLAIAGIDDSAVAIALLTNLLNLNLKIFAPSNSSRRQVKLIERFGADIVWTAEEAGTCGAIEEAARWSREASDRIFVDGYRREAVNEAYREMASEILDALNGQVLAAFVTSVTTGGTLRHVAGKLRETHPDLQVGGAVLTDTEFPELSAYSYNRLTKIGLKKAWEMRDYIAREEGLLLSPKGAAAVHLALKMRPDLPKDAVIVALNPDSGQRYLGWEDKPLFEVTFRPDII